MRKSCSRDREKLLNFEAKGREFAKNLRSLEQILHTVGQNNFGNKISFTGCGLCWGPSCIFLQCGGILGPLVFGSVTDVNFGTRIPTRMGLL